jgi:hypothetical protein
VWFSGEAADGCAVGVRRGILHPMSFLFRHWRGELSLAVAFWINLVALRFALVGVDHLWGPPVTEDIAAVLPWAMAYVAVSVLIVFPWQVVGVLRATDRILGELGSSAIVLVTQIGIVISLLVTAVSAFAVFQPLMARAPEGPDWFALRAEREARYDVSVDPGGAAVRITGEFELGLTRRLRTVLRDTPGAREIILESPGGYVGQGRAVARLIEERGLATRVETSCESACVIAFLSGTHRTLMRGARLGFHPYRMEGLGAHPSIDAREEFAADSRGFAAKGVDPAFLERVAAVPDGEIWFPSTDELIAAGVVDSVVDGVGGTQP